MIKMYEITSNNYISECELSQLEWTEIMETMEYVVTIGGKEVLRIDLYDFDVWYRSYGFRFKELIQ